MYVQTCTNRNINSAQRLTFKNKKRDENYYAFMSRHSEDIVQASVIAGALTGTFAARKNISEELVPNIFRNIGISTMGLFGITSAIFAMPPNEQSNKK